MVRLDTNASGEARAAAGLGAVGLVAWLTPDVGLVTSGLAVGLGVKGLRSRRGMLAVVGIVFGCAGAALAVLMALCQAGHGVP